MVPPSRRIIVQRTCGPGCRQGDRTRLSVDCGATGVLLSGGQPDSQEWHPRERTVPRSTRPRSSQAWTKQRRRRPRTALLAGLLLAGAAPGPAALAFGWQADTPENQGMCGSTFTAACHRTLASIVAGDKATSAFIVIRNDRIVFEWYANGGGQDVGNSLHSANKALFGGTAMAYAVNRCGLVPTAPAGSLIPGRTTPPKSQIQIVHLATHNATLDDPLDTAKHSCSSPLWQTRFWSLCQPPNDPWTIARTLTPTLAGEQPGQYFWYSNPGLALLGYAVTKQCRDTHPDGHDNTLLKIMGRYVMAPIGAPATSWQEIFHRTLQDGGPLTLYGTGAPAAGRRARRRWSAGCSCAGAFGTTRS